jgi:hypothetical protein
VFRVCVCRERSSSSQADTNHKSAQHFHLAENLSNEIYAPVG